MPQKRSSSQNNSLQLYCRELARTLNESGISQAIFFRDIEADYSEETIRNLFRSFGKAKYGKAKTSELTTKELSDLYEEVNRHTSKLGIHIPWPSINELITY